MWYYPKIKLAKSYLSEEISTAGAGSLGPDDDVEDEQSIFRFFLLFLFFFLTL